MLTVVATRTSIGYNKSRILADVYWKMVRTMKMRSPYVTMGAMIESICFSRFTAFTTLNIAMQSPADFG